MRAILWLFAALLACAAASDEKKIVCYFGSWAVYRPDAGRIDIENIDPKLCTHLIYTFVGLNSDASIRIIDPWGDLPDGKDGFNKFNKLRSLSPSTKTLIAIGGWNGGSTTYSRVLSKPELRKAFVKNAVEFVKKYNFEGLDFDWEYPNQRGGVEEDKKNYILLLKELRKRFDEEGLILSAAVGAAEKSASLSYIIPEVSKYLHFINLMAYDMHGVWDKKTGINAPLYAGSWETDAEALLNVNASVNYWISQGAPREKLVLGVPFYGRSFTLDNVSQKRIGSPARFGGEEGPYTRLSGTLGYNEICEKLINEKWEVHYQEEQRVPYAVKGDQWVGYDNAQSLTEKAEFINNLGLGGVMLWSIETDDFRGNCGEKYPLLKTLNRVLRNGAPAPTPTTTTTESSPTPESPKTTTDGSVNIECTKTGYVRDPKDCSVFYFCIPNGDSFTKQRFECAKGLSFDLKLMVCNWPEQVDCSVSK